MTWTGDDLIQTGQHFTTESPRGASGIRNLIFLGVQQDTDADMGEHGHVDDTHLLLVCETAIGRRVSFSIERPEDFTVSKVLPLASPISLQAAYAMVIRDLKDNGGHTASEEAIVAALVERHEDVTT